MQHIICSFPNLILYYSSDASDGDVIILPQSDHDGHYYLLKEPENELELLDFMQAIKDGKAERHGTSAIGRFVSDFLNGFIRLFKENPILGSLIGKFNISSTVENVNILF